MTDEIAESIQKNAETQAIELKHKLDSLVVKDQPSFEAGEALRATIKEAEKVEIDNVKEEKDRRHDEWKKVVAIETAIKKKYAELKEPLLNKLKAYAEEQRRKAEEARRIAAEAARKQAEEQRLAQATALESAGHQGAAEAMIEAPIPEVATKKIDVPKVKGLRENWKYEIIDKKAFLKGCLEEDGCLNIGCAIEDSKVVGQMVRALKSNFKAPGIRVFCEK